MNENSFELKILGRVDKKILSKFYKVLALNGNNNQIVFFCDYSTFNIPIGYNFKKIYDSNEKCIYSGMISLERVTQAHALPYQFIPYGHKTICKFLFRDSEVPFEVIAFNEISDWYDSKSYFILK